MPDSVQSQVRPDGSVVVTDTVANILDALAADLDNDLDNIRQGKGDPLASIENTAANLRLLASGTWGQGTVTDDDMVRHLSDEHGVDPNRFAGNSDDDPFAFHGDDHDEPEGHTHA